MSDKPFWREGWGLLAIHYTKSRAGELLAGMDLQGSNQHGRKLHDVTSSLKDLGIERMQSRRWQTQAIAKGFDTSDDESDAVSEVPLLAAARHSAVRKRLA